MTASVLQRRRQPGPKPLGYRLLFFAFVLSPLAVLAILCWLIVVSLQAGPAMENAHVGAGAGDTGGANAIGEMLERRGLE